MGGALISVAFAQNAVLTGVVRDGAGAVVANGATVLLLTETDRFKAAVNVSGKVDMISSTPTASALASAIHTPLRRARTPSAQRSGSIRSASSSTPRSSVSIA